MSNVIAFAFVISVGAAGAYKFDPPGCTACTNELAFVEALFGEVEDKL
ncbi:MAG: hypothetical protein U0640_11280 [Phycisphaerales bacterium]